MVPSKGTVKFDLIVDNICVPTSATVVPNHAQDTPLLIGHPVTEKSDVVYKDSERLQLFQKLPTIERTDETIRKISLWPKKLTIIPAGFWGNVEVEVKNDFEGELYVEASIRTGEGQEWCIPNSVLRISSANESILPVVNLSDADVSLSSKQPVARGWPCEPGNENNESILRTSEVPLELLTISDITTGPISEEIQSRLLNILNKYRHCFAIGTDELGCAKSSEITIELDNNTPFSYRPYHMSKGEQETVRQIIDDLLQNDIIRESNSPYSSPILLVRKKNGEERMCVDYRHLNRMTVKDRYPLPRIDDQLDKLQGSVLYSSLDLRSGYHQIPIAEGSKKYTAFVTAEGQYEYNRMPFGLTNAPSAFQRLMNRVLKAVRQIAAIYLDDILLYAKTLEEALENLEKVLKLLEAEGLTLNPSKCKFLVTSVEYLGFEISNSMVRPGEMKTKAVREFEVPQSVHQVRQFLGLTGDFRQFVRNYALIAKPLTDLTRKSVEWVWAEKEQQAFENLKQTLVTRPLLALFNPNAHTEVHTDASSRGLAGILLQKQDRENGRLHPVVYYSRKTTPLEEKFHSYELETLAVVESLKKVPNIPFGS